MIEGSIGTSFQRHDSISYWQEKYLINVILLVKINLINIFSNSLGKKSNDDVKYHYYLESFCLFLKWLDM